MFDPNPAAPEEMAGLALYDLRAGTVRGPGIETRLDLASRELTCDWCHGPIPKAYLHFAAFRPLVSTLHVACHVDVQRTPTPERVECDEPAPGGGATHNRDARAYLRLHGLSPWTGHPLGPAAALQEDMIAEGLRLPEWAALSSVAALMFGGMAP